MNVSLKWLNEIIDLSAMTTQEIDDLLTFAGIEVEGIEQKGLDSEFLVVAQVKEAEKHPEADKLKICKVDAGEGELRQIVCGAQNYKVGDKVPCALPGAVLPGDFKIKEGKLRGVASLGMLCGASEIGLVDAEDGLMILPEDFEVGKRISEYFTPDTIFEVEVTPNRPDCLSHEGMARELHTLSDLSYKFLEADLLETTPSAEIQLKAGEAAPYYTALNIKKVTIAPSPEWLQEKLEAIGLTPINNIVDITNYVLHQTGQPLHAFDAAKINGNIQVITAEGGETFSALDENEYALEAGDVIISDESNQLLALGGIMGGMESSVSESTSDILLEAAWFNSKDIRRTGRRLGLVSDSSYRFERGADPATVVRAASIAAKLIVEIAGGSIEGKLAVAGSNPWEKRVVSLDIARMNQLMDNSISLEKAISILEKLGLEKESQNEESVEFIIPSFRPDLERHIDLVEEIARVHGLDNVPSKFIGYPVPESAVDKAYDFQLALKHKLAAKGLYETQTLKLIASAQIQDCLTQKPLMDGDLIPVSRPLSEDNAILRPSMTAGLVGVAGINARQNAKSFRFFEMGRIFRNAGGGKAKDLESDALGILIGGESRTASWNQSAETSDLYELKGLIESIVPRAKIQFSAKDRKGFFLASNIEADGKPIGVFAQLLPSRCRELDLPNKVYLVELDLGKLQKISTGVIPAKDLPQFPGSSRDLAMEIPKTLSAAKIQDAIKKVNESLLVDVFCFDVFEDSTGEKLDADKRSIAYRFTYRSDDKTLKAKEVDKAHKNIVDTLVNKLKVVVR